MIKGHISRNDSSGTNTTYFVYESLNSSEAVFEIEADGANFQQADGSTPMVITIARTLKLVISNHNLNSSSLSVIRYRRVGTNS